MSRAQRQPLPTVDKQFRVFSWDVDAGFNDASNRDRNILPSITKQTMKVFQESKPADAVFLLDAYSLTTVDGRVLKGTAHPDRFAGKSIYEVTELLNEESAQTAKTLGFEHSLLVEYNDAVPRDAAIEQHKFMIALGKKVVPSVSYLATRNAVKLEFMFDGQSEPTTVIGVDLPFFSQDKQANNTRDLIDEAGQADYGSSALIIGRLNALKKGSIAGKFLKTPYIGKKYAQNNAFFSGLSEKQILDLPKSPTLQMLTKAGYESAVLSPKSTVDIGWLPFVQIDYAMFTKETLQITDEAIVDMAGSSNKAVIAEIAPISYQDNYMGSFYNTIRDIPH